MAKVGKDGWIRWRGNDTPNFIPEELGTKVEIRLRNKVHHTIRLNKLMGTTWKHYGRQRVAGNSDIMAYRIVEWADGFKPWYGNGIEDNGGGFPKGNGPVEDDVVVFYVMRNAKERHVEHQLAAGELRWTHRGSAGDIVAWKLAEQPAKVAPQKLEAVVIPPAPPAIEKKEAPKKPVKPVGWWT